jgi:hypothetical protein
LRAPKIEKFASEAAMCASFMAAVGDKWVSYPETCKWDILLVNKQDGRQVGVQAKLKLNAKVFAQAVEDRWDTERPGPDYRAVLIPSDERSELGALAPYLGVTVIGMRGEGAYYRPFFSPSLPDESVYSGTQSDWFDRMPVLRHILPEYVPDVAAGASSPLQLTKWKVAAIKLALLLNETGLLTRDDFKYHQIDIRHWIGISGWLTPGPLGFVATASFPDFRRQHPRVWDEIAADPSKWLRKHPVLTPSRQQALL